MTYEHQPIQRKGPINRTGLWRVTTRGGIIHWFDWERQKYARPPKGSSRNPPAGGDWLSMLYPMDFLEMGYPFRVILDEENPLYANNVVQIEQVSSDRIPQVQVQESMDLMPVVEPIPERSARATADVSEPLWTIDQLVAYLQVVVKSVYNLRAKRRGPAALTVGGRLRWNRKEVERWIAEITERSSDN